MQPKSTTLAAGVAPRMGHPFETTRPQGSTLTGVLLLNIYVSYSLNAIDSNFFPCSYCFEVTNFGLINCSAKVISLSSRNQVKLRGSESEFSLIFPFSIFGLIPCLCHFINITLRKPWISKALILSYLLKSWYAVNGCCGLKVCLCQGNLV